MDKITELVQGMDNIPRITCEDAYLCLEFLGNDAELSELLHRLVNDGLAVMEFFIKTEGMQEQYLETIRA
ncbi:MAG: hypothetical protein D3922_14885 [Candidatus Electrothrix sp. AR1]|nr:hypothetical protein [Candidatus Electrothrix sp. AR1]